MTAQLQARSKRYQKLLLTAWSVDQHIWKNLGPYDYTLPQIEYIESPALVEGFAYFLEAFKFQTLT